MRGKGLPLCLSLCVLFGADACSKSRDSGTREIDPRIAQCARWVPFSRKGDGALFFLDRFEFRIGDLRAASRLDGGAALFEVLSRVPRHADPDLPAANLDLLEGMAAARLFFARLPRLEEWRQAVEGHAGFRFPWGDRFESLGALRANTLELGLLRPTRVGTFESGRDPSREDACYDLFGNLAEWVLDPPPSLFTERGEGGVSEILGRGRRDFWVGVESLLDLLRPWNGARPWLPVFLRPLPSNERLPCVSIGFGFLSWIRPQAGDGRKIGPYERLGLEGRDPRERASDLGLRLATDPWTFLAGLAAVEGEPGEEERAILGRFLGRHAAAFRAAALARRRMAGPDERGTWLEAAVRILGLRP